MKRCWLLFLFVVTGALALQFTSGCAPQLPSGEVADEKVTDGGPDKAPQKDLCDSSSVCKSCYDTNDKKITCPTTSKKPTCELLGEGKARTAQCSCPNGFKSAKVDGNLACQLYDSCTNYAQCRDGYICNSDGKCIVGCSDDEGKQCAEGLICYNKQCKRDCTTSSCQNNEACVKGVCLAAECGYGTLKCKAGQICSQKRCYATCSKEVKCANGFFCDTNKKCIAECSDDSSCKAGEICEQKAGGKQCVSAQCSDSTGCQGSKRFCNKGRCEDKCKFDSACKSTEVCRANKCVTGCTADSSCQKGEVCKKSDPACTGDNCLKGCFKSCAEQKDCSTGSVCTDGVCRTGCSKDDDCPSGQKLICLQSQCVPGCREDSECKGNEICSEAKCILGCRKSTACSAGQVCKANKCSACTSNGDCSGLNICQNGKCSSRPDCTSNRDCQEGQRCENPNKSTAKCVEGCDSNRDCKTGDTCDGGKCVTPCSSTSCPKGQYCASNGQCTSGCKKDIHCPSNQPKCDNGTCTIECVSNTQPVCLDGTLCKGFKCGTACTLDSECKDPTKICTAGKCVPRQCASSAACSGGLVCKSNRCVKCSADSECGTGKRCSNGACVTPGTCSTKADCASGQVCASGKCVECAAGSDCPSAKPICDSSKCVECGDDSNCSGGKKCIAGTCTDVTVVCSKDSDCNTGQICTSNKCVAAQCSSSKLCPSGQVCLSRRCEAKCDPTKCATGKVCDTVTNKCGDCKADTDCGTGNVCDSGSCKKAPEKCTQTSDCTSPFVCKNGTCQTCLNNSDCANGEECKAGKCEKIKVQCDASNPCQGGQVCSSGQCIDCAADTDCKAAEYCATVAGVGKRCQTGCRASSCPSGKVCDTAAAVPQCVTCVTDTHCASSTTGKFCVSNQCVACKGDSDCASGEVCQSNTCKPKGNACLTNADCTGGSICNNGQCQFQCSATTTVCSTPGYICLKQVCQVNTTIVASPRRKSKHTLVIDVGSALYNSVEIYDVAGRRWSTTQVNKYRQFIKGKMQFTYPTDSNGDLQQLQPIPVVDGLGAQPCPPANTTDRAKAFASFADWKCNTAKTTTGTCSMFGLQELTSTYGPSYSITNALGKCPVNNQAADKRRNWSYYTPASQP